MKWSGSNSFIHRVDKFWHSQSLQTNSWDWLHKKIILICWSSDFHMFSSKHDLALTEIWCDAGWFIWIDSNVR